MSKKHRAVCTNCNYRGDAFVNSISAKKQRNKHQRDTNYEHNVGIEITEEILTFISSENIDNPTSKANKNKLL